LRLLIYVMASMNLFDRDVTAEMVMEMLGILRTNERKAREDYYDTIDDYYYNLVADDGRVSKYFPQLQSETKDEYESRVKMAFPWARIFIRYAVNYFWAGGETVYEWAEKAESEGDEKDDAMETLKKEANAITQKMFAINDYHSKKSSYLTHTLMYSDTLEKPKFIRFNPDDGKEIKLDEVKGYGTVYWSEIQSFFFVPVYHPKFHDKIAGVVICYDFDNNADYKFSQENISENYKRVMEWISADSYCTTKANTLETEGKWQAWEKTAGKKDWEPIPDDDGNPTDLNPYGFLPVVIWQTPDGESMVEKAINLINDYNQQISQVANALFYMGQPQYQFLGPQPAKGQAIESGPTRILYTGDPEGKQRFEVLQPAYNEAPAKTLLDKLERVMSFVFAIPLEVVNGMVDAQSGIQLKMLFTSLIQLRNNLQLTIGNAEREKMLKTIKIWEIENKAQGRYSDVLKPVVKYAKNIIPADDATEITNDIILLDKGLAEKVDMLMKYNPDKFSTKEEAEKFVAAAGVSMQKQVETETDELENELFPGKKKGFAKNEPTGKEK